MGKLETPEWIREGYASKVAWEKKKGIKIKKPGTKTYKIKACPKCGSTEVRIVLGQEEGKGKSEWECKSCKWKGMDIGEKELSDIELLEHMEKIDGK